MINLRGRALPRRLIAIVAGLVSIYLILLIGQEALAAYQADQQVQAARHEIAALRQRNIELQAELSSDQMDVEIERTAREELNLTRPGDHPVVLLWPEKGQSETPPQAAPTPSPEPRWRGWARLFFDAGPGRQ